MLVTGRQRLDDRAPESRDAQERPAHRQPERRDAPRDGEPSSRPRRRGRRARADEARRRDRVRAHRLGRRSSPRAAKTPVKYEPVDEEELGVSRRQFFNRSILAAIGARPRRVRRRGARFLWPSAGGFGGKVDVGIAWPTPRPTFDNKSPYYNAGAKTYISPYPKAGPPEGQEGPGTPRSSPGMEQGYVALYQKCVHLGCRVPWCQTSQWFECPCHGSKYNRVGEKRGGPAPRGLDRFVARACRAARSRSTPAIVVIGPPIGTDTTGQSAEGRALRRDRCPPTEPADRRGT